MRRRERWALAAASLAVIASACSSGSPSVGVQALEADIVFGAKPVDDRPVAPPAILAEPVVEPTEVSADAPPTRIRGPLTGLTSLSECPPATVTAIPERELGVNSVGTPPEGKYRWKRTRSELTGGQETSKSSGFESRLVRRVTKLNDTDFTYQMVQPVGDGDVLVTTFKMLPNPPLQQDVTPPAGDVPVRVGQPDRGLSLIRIERLDRNGAATGRAFAPEPPVLYLPVPVFSGESWEAVGVDAASGAVLRHSAQVVRRQRIDACGALVDGWLVEASQTFQGASDALPTGTAVYRYVVSAQYGGLVVFEGVEQLDEDMTGFKQDFQLAQLHPDALPPEAK
jgi:hypothetical protein